MKIKIKKIVVENTTYSLLLYFLLENKWKDSVFILTKNYFDNKFLVKMKKKVKVLETELPFIKKDSLVKKVLRYYFEKIYWNIFSIYNRKVLFYGNDALEVSRFFRKNRFYIIEDGLVNYESLKQNNIKKLRIKNFLKLEFKFFIPYGIEKNVEKIFLTGLAPIPNEIDHKVEIINLKELWNKKTMEEQSEILDIFSFDLNIKDIIKGKDIILFTQPLSEDSILYEEEKINIYKEIIKKYPKEKLIIKTHPREKTNYKEIFKEYLVLDNPFPFEIFNLLDVKFKKAVTLFSTAALGLDKDVEIDFYGTEAHPKIFSRFGSYNNIMKRNVFLDENIE